jgi:hypothetical protein
MPYESHPPVNLAANKSNVVAFYDLMFNQCRPAEAIRRYAGSTYTQHSRDGWMRQSFARNCAESGRIGKQPLQEGAKVGVPVTHPVEKRRALVR